MHTSHLKIGPQVFNTEFVSNLDSAICVLPHSKTYYKIPTPRVLPTPVSAPRLLYTTVPAPRLLYTPVPAPRLLHTPVSAHRSILLQHPMPQHRCPHLLHLISTTQQDNAVGGKLFDRITIRLETINTPLAGK